MAHTEAQPRLQDHSWNPDTDLMKRWMVYEQRPGMYGKLAIASFDHFNEAWDSLPDTTTPEFDGEFYRLVDGDTIYSIELQF